MEIFLQVFFNVLHWTLSIFNIVSLRTRYSVFSVSVSKFDCACILAQLYGCAQTTLCVNTSLVVGVGASTPACVSESVSMYVLIDGVTAGCQAYLQPPASSFASSPAPPSPRLRFHPCLIWQHRRRRAGARVTKGHGSSSKDTLMPLFPPPSSPCLFTLPSLFSPPCSISSSSPHFCLHFNFLHLPCLPLIQ